MISAVELTLRLIALAVVVVLTLDLARGRSRRRQRVHLERLAGPDSEPEEVLPDRPRPLERRLLAAGLPIGPVGFLLALGLFAIVVFGLLLLLLPGFPVPCLLAAVVLAYVVWVAVVEAGKFRARRFERRLIDAVDHMVSALLAGEVPARALANAAEVSEGAVRTELKEVVHRLEVGMGIREALERMVRRYDSEGVRLFSQTLAVKWQAGGDLAPVLRKVAWIMRERMRLAMRLRTELTGVQVAALGIALFPYLLIPVLLWQRPDWVELLTRHPLGPPLLVAAVVLQVIGLLWLRRIVRVEL